MLLCDSSVGRTGTPKPVRQGTKKKIKHGGTCACENTDNTDNGLGRQEGSTHAVYIRHNNEQKWSQFKGRKQKFHGLCVLNNKNHMGT
jgi:hypothetical protein